MVDSSPEDWGDIHNLTVDCSLEEQVAKIETAFILFEEQATKDISRLEDQFDKQSNILDLQEKQIADLLEIIRAQSKELKVIKQKVNLSIP